MISPNTQTQRFSHTSCSMKGRRNHSTSSVSSVDRDLRSHALVIKFKGSGQAAPAIYIVDEVDVEACSAKEFRPARRHSPIKDSRCQILEADKCLVPTSAGLQSLLTL